jgi:hypothetical protein
MAKRLQAATRGTTGFDDGMTGSFGQMDKAQAKKA